jgi:hypothetical protein
LKVREGKKDMSKSMSTIKVTGNQELDIISEDSHFQDSDNCKQIRPLKKEMRIIEDAYTMPSQSKSLTKA